jgi:hypothetical protein
MGKFKVLAPAASLGACSVKIENIYCYLPFEINFVPILHS